MEGEQNPSPKPGGTEGEEETLRWRAAAIADEPDSWLELALLLRDADSLLGARSPTGYTTVRA